VVLLALGEGSTEEDLTYVPSEVEVEPQGKGKEEWEEHTEAEKRKHREDREDEEVEKEKPKAKKVAGLVRAESSKAGSSGSTEEMPVWMAPLLKMGEKLGRSLRRIVKSLETIADEIGDRWYEPGGESESEEYETDREDVGPRCCTVMPWAFLTSCHARHNQAPIAMVIYSYE